MSGPALLDSEILKTERALAAANESLRLDLLQAAADLAGVVDPTPLSDAAGAAISLYRGDLLGAGLSLVSMVPYAGDALGKTAKGAKLAKRMAETRKKIAALTAKLTKLRAAKSNAAQTAAKTKAAAAAKTKNGKCATCPQGGGGRPPPEPFQKMNAKGREDGAEPTTRGKEAELDEGESVRNAGQGLSKAGWPDVSAHERATFRRDPTPETLTEGTKLRRVVGAENNPNGAYWVRAEDFPASKAEWRRAAAVRGDWNGDGGYVEFTVPKGGMNVWSGPARAQRSADGVSVLRGGGDQILLDPAKLAGGVSKPKPTGW